MHPEVESRLSELTRLCEKHHVERLDLFGSAAADAFDPTRSDLDFLVDFQNPLPGRMSDAYFGLLDDLRSLFQRRVDLVMSSAVRNRYFRRQVEQTKVPVYASAG